MTRYRAYQAHLAGSSIGDAFSQAVAFLTLAASSAALIADSGTPAAP